MAMETAIPTGYALSVCHEEGEHLMAGLELAVAARRGEPERNDLIAGIDAETLDRLSDVLVRSGIHAQEAAPITWPGPHADGGSRPDPRAPMVGSSLPRRLR